MYLILELNNETVQNQRSCTVQKDQLFGLYLDTIIPKILLPSPNLHHIRPRDDWYWEEEPELPQWHNGSQLIAMVSPG